MSERIEWEGTEAQQQQERVKACRERCAQWGEPDEGDDCDGDGSCAECEMDMAEALETEESRARRRTARAAASAPAGDGVEAMRVALERSREGWSNAIEFGIIPPQHRNSAKILADECAAALARPRAAVGERGA